MIITSIAKIGKYKNDLFFVHSERDGKYLIHTLIPDKVKKYEMEGNYYDGFNLRVPKEEVESLFDEQCYRRKLFNINLMLRKVLSEVDYKWVDVNEQLKQEFEKNHIILSREANIRKTNQQCWRIVDRMEQFQIKDVGMEIVVHNGGVL